MKPKLITRLIMITLFVLINSSSGDKALGLNIKPPLQATVVNYDVKLQWYNYKNIRYYELYRSLGTSNKFTKIVRLQKNSYVNKGLPSAIYNYKIRVIYKSGKSSYTNLLKVIVSPRQPYLTEIKAKSSSEIGLKWSKVPGASIYEIYKSNTLNGLYSRISTTADIEINIKNLTAATTYWFKIKSVNKSILGKYSKVVSTTTKPGIPTGLSVIPLDNHQIKINWDSQPNIKEYEIYRSFEESENYIKIAQTNTDTFTDLGFALAPNYFYKIKAVNESGESEFSQEVSVTTKAPSNTELFVAHRGSSAIYPENTMLAFKKAEEEGAKAIELDVVISRDGVPYIMHDDTVDRTTNGTGRCYSLLWSKLSTLDAGSWKGPQFTGEHIPSLEEVLDYFKGKNIFLFIEIKNNPVYTFEDLPAKVANLIINKDMSKQCLIMSFNWNYIDQIKKANPTIYTGLLGSGDVTTAINRAIEGNHKFLCWNHLNLNEAIINQVKSKGLALDAWTINNSDSIQNMINLKVNYITSDYPSNLVDLGIKNNITQIVP